MPIQVIDTTPGWIGAFGNAFTQAYSQGARAYEQDQDRALRERLTQQELLQQAREQQARRNATEIQNALAQQNRDEDLAENKRRFDTNLAFQQSRLDDQKARARAEAEQEAAKTANVNSILREQAKQYGIDPNKAVGYHTVTGKILPEVMSHLDPQAEKASTGPTKLDLLKESVRVAESRVKSYLGSHDYDKYLADPEGMRLAKELAEARKKLDDEINRLQSQQNPTANPPTTQPSGQPTSQPPANPFQYYVDKNTGKVVKQDLRNNSWSEGL